MTIAALDWPDFYTPTISMVAEAAAGRSKHEHLRAQARGRRDYKHTPPKEPTNQTEEAETEASGSS